MCLKCRQYARTLPNVVLADENLFTCSQDTQEKMKKVIDEHRPQQGHRCLLFAQDP